MVRKRIIFLLGILVFIAPLLTLGQVKAHNPSNMILGYDFVDDSLHVVIDHPTEDLYTHYIFEVNVTLNGNFIASSGRSSQYYNSSTFRYSITANFGDLIAVTARCTQGGIITRSITIGQENVNIPGFVGLLIIIGVSTIIMIAIFYKKLSIRVVKW